MPLQGDGVVNLKVKVLKRHVSGPLALKQAPSLIDHDRQDRLSWWQVVAKTGTISPV